MNTLQSYFSVRRGTRPTVTKAGHHILEVEVVKALNSMSTGKAAGPDRVLTEMILALKDFGIAKITHAEDEMCKSIFITLPKKPATIKCDQHRTISLMSHLTELVLRILINRLRGRTAGEVAEEQYGFQKDKGTENAIFILRMMTERVIEMQNDLDVCFIDYIKAFDKDIDIDIDGHEV